MNACKEPGTGIRFEEAEDAFENIFRAEYQGIARAIARVNRDPGRAEELAVEVFLKWSRNRAAQKDKARGWLYSTAFRMALDDLRAQMRRHRYKHLLEVMGTRRPDEEFAQKEEQGKIRTMLATITRRESTMLLLRSQGFGYSELAEALGLNGTSVGTLFAGLNRHSEKSMKDDMASNNDIDVETWVERRLAILHPDRAWEPNVDAGLRRFSGVSKGAPQWIRTAVWASALAGTICLCLLWWAPTRVFARGCVNACLAQVSIAGKMLRDRMPGKPVTNVELTPLGNRRTAIDFAERD